MIETSKSCYFLHPQSAVWLVDNGSLRAQSVLALREQALKLGEMTGICVEAVSVLHSNKVPAQELGGKAARVFTPHLRTCAASGLRRLLVLPYFFGPSAALTDYLPRQIARVQQEFPQLEVCIAPPLVDLSDPADSAVQQIAALLAEKIEVFLQADAVTDAIASPDAGVVPHAATAGSLANLPAAILVDHGSPQPAVSAVRDQVGAALGNLLQGRVRAFAVCSMEAREGGAYAHTLPLLEQVLQQQAFCHGKVIVAPLFLSPGRHAGKGGDLQQIAEQVKATNPLLEVVFCPLLGGSCRITEILATRLQGQIDWLG